MWWMVNLRSRGLTSLPASIADLRHLVSLSLPAAPLPLPLARSSLARSVSGPLGPASVDRAASWGRTFSGSLAPVAVAPVPPSRVPLNLYLSQNRLSAGSLPPALFSLDNLTVLTLRGNRLAELPPGIGRLHALVELNVASNGLEWLPAELGNLPRLRVLALHPNHFIAPPAEPTTSSISLSPLSANTTPVRPRLVSPVQIHFTVPSLVELCTRVLLAHDPDYPTNPVRNIALEPSLRNLPRHLLAPFAEAIPSAFTLATPPTNENESLYDPLASICCSPAHADAEVVYYRHAVERFEWVSEASLKEQVPGQSPFEGPRVIPLRHRGCGSKCLDWLDE